MEKTILQVCGYAAPYPGNFISTLRALSDKCQKKGYQTIFAFPESAKNLAWCKQLQNDYRVYFLPLNKARINPSTYKKMKNIYASNNIVIVHSHFELYDMPATLTAPEGVKVFWHLHDALDLIYRKSNFFYRLLWRYQYSIASKRAFLLSVSEKGRNFAVKLGFHKEKAFFLPNGIDTERIDKVEGNQDNTYDFLMYGWDFKRKGVDILLDTLKEMNDDFTCALVAGDDVWNTIEHRKYSQLIKQPAVDNVAELYRSTKCFLHISRQEGLSYALLEAIYAGCSVICSDIEQNQFAEGIPTVKFVRVGNTDDLKQAMEDILTGKFITTKKAIAQAKLMVREEYSIETWNNRVLEYYLYE